MAIDAYGIGYRVNPTLKLLNDRAADEKTVAERKWEGRKLAPAPQKQCDHGLFSDDAKQTDFLDLTRA